MYLKYLPNESMVSISGGWVAKGPVRERIEQYPPLAGALHLVVPAHERLVALGAKMTGSPHAAKLAELTERSTALDARFDRALKGGLGLCTIAASLVEEPAQRARIEADRDELYPEGASLTNSSYTNESGSVVALGAKLAQNPKLERRVTRIKLVVEFAKGPAQTFTVGSLLREQIEAGAALGESEQARRELEEGAPLASSEKQPSELSKARTAWIRAVNSFVDAAEQLEGFDEGDRKKFFGTLAAALDKVSPARPAKDDDGEGDEPAKPTEEPKAQGDQKK